MSTESVRAESADIGTQPVNMLAIVAAAMGVLAVVGLFLAGMAIIAVFVVGAGHVALNQIEQRGERGRVLAVSALVIGYGIAALSLVSALIYTFTR
ncbi:DUF4190 domain-containing protein [Paenarthrobacter sp. NPDC089675]|uniref:DUF4190 domain-containing protein n=1 Tax=Paenarthrobacter sp. NPDC089675 TaxID=3364376 RepID=UPI003805F44A